MDMINRVLKMPILRREDIYTHKGSYYSLSFISQQGFYFQGSLSPDALMPSLKIISTEYILWSI